MANNFNWIDETTLDGVLWEEGTLSSTTPINQIGILNIEGNVGVFKDLDSQLNNTGTIIENHDDTADLFFEDGAVLNNSGTYIVERGRISKSISDSGVINNSGTFRKTTSSTGTVGVVFNNYQGSEIGTVDVEAGELIIGQGGSSGGGNFDIGNGGILNFAGLDDDIYILNNGSQINGTGNLAIDGGILDIRTSEGTSIADTLELSLTGGTLQTDDDWTLSAPTIWNSGTLKSSGTITNDDTVEITGSSDLKHLDAQLDNTGAIIQNHGGVGIADLRLEDGAVINNSGTYTLERGTITKSISDSGAINNSGTFRKTTSDIGEVNVIFNNTGTLSVQEGTLNLNDTYIHENADLVLKGGDLSFNSNTNVDLDGGSIEGYGTINIGVNSSGLLNPRHINDTEFGTLGIDGDYTETDTASIQIEIGSGSENIDRVGINGIADLNGILNVSLLDEFIPMAGERYVIIGFVGSTILSKLDFTGLNINDELQFVPRWFNNQLSLDVVDRATLSSLTDLNVTTTEDLLNLDDSVLSLREAIIQANETTLDKTITLGEGTYSLNISGREENQAATGDLDILPRAGVITIRGQGEDRTIIDANSLDRFLEILPGATVNLSGVTITGGEARGRDGRAGEDGSNGSPQRLTQPTGEVVTRGEAGENGETGENGEAGNGGGIRNDGTLTITDTTIRDNQAIGGDGGNGGNGGNGSTFDDGLVPPSGGRGGNGGNGGNGNGGAIYNSGELLLTNVDFEGNTISSGNGGNAGAGGNGGTNGIETGSSGEPGNGGDGGDVFGGSIYNSFDEEITLDSNSQFSNNSVLTLGSGGSGSVSGSSGIAEVGDTNSIYNEGTESSGETQTPDNVDSSSPDNISNGVYRFFNQDTGVHFYTGNEAERDAVLELPNFSFEGASYESIDPLTGDPEPSPVYRFLNQDTGVHLYTISEAERDATQQLDNFSFEGEAFFAYPTEVDGSIPIYRFFNTTSGAHFYTPSAAERDNVEANLPDFQSEGIAYYALPIEE